jgi:hypothetical protein
MPETKEIACNIAGGILAFEMCWLDGLISMAHLTADARFILFCADPSSRNILPGLITSDEAIITLISTDDDHARLSGRLSASMRRRRTACKQFQLTLH